jgi:hypothetical protein
MDACMHVRACVRLGSAHAGPAELELEPRMPRAAADRVGRTAACAMAKKHALVTRACARVCVVIVNFKPAA